MRSGRSEGGAPSVARALAPHWGAAFALALFLLVGLAALDDYGVTWDELTERETGEQTLALIRGESDALFAGHGKFYGVAFQMPLLLAERAFGLDDSRAIYLSRHLLTHLLHLAGGLFAYLLARRLFGAGSLVALFAMLLFLLHPRLYAHSFANSKDLPFLAMFMTTLFLTHWAFRRGSLPVFALAGVAAGALLNLRIMGIVLLAAVPAMAALDFVFAKRWAERKRAVVASGAFALAALLTAYALLPYLWADPVGRAAEWWTLASNHPHWGFDLFRGTRYVSVDLPADYLPGWIAVTSPPFALLLGLLGGGVVLAGAVKAPRAWLREKERRFALLLTGSFILPIIAVILLEANIYDEWRQAYFLWAPFSLLGAYGLARLASAFNRARLRAAVYGAAGAGAAAMAVSMALLHPNQQDAFNFFVDRVAPEHLRSQYLMGYWSHPTRQALEWALDQSPDSTVTVNVRSHDRYRPDRTMLILPREDRERLSLEQSADALVFTRRPPREAGRELSAVKVYNNTALSIQRKPDLRQAYESALQGSPIISSGFDVYAVDGSLIYVKEPCAPSDIDNSTFYLRVFPEDEESLPSWWKVRGYEELKFYFQGHGAAFDGKCVAVVPLPDYPTAGFAASQRRDWPPSLLWEESASDPTPHREALRAALRSSPVARSVFDVYLTDGSLLYVREACDASDVEARFFLHILPERVGDLPEERRQYGFDNLDFDFFLNGATFDGNCVAQVALPEYEMREAATGQFTSAGALWGTGFAFPE